MEDYEFTYYNMTEPAIVKTYHDKDEWIEAIKSKVYRLSESIFVYIKGTEKEFASLTVTKQASEIIDFVESEGADFINIFEAENYDEVMSMLGVIFEKWKEGEDRN